MAGSTQVAKRELSSADRCKRHNWYVGSVLRSVSHSGEKRFWRITAIGEREVLGIETRLPEKTTSGESILNICGPNYQSWHKYEDEKK
jgi:hypothetical protein